MNTIPLDAFSFTSSEVKELLQVAYKPANGGYTLKDILAALEKLEMGYASTDSHTFTEALFGKVSRGKVALTDDANLLGTFDASVMFSPGKLIGEKVTLGNGIKGRIINLESSLYRFVVFCRLLLQSLAAYGIL